MRAFTQVTGVAAPLLRPNIDTDQIIPSREMKGVSKSGLADGLFAGWRYMSIGDRKPDPGFVLNNPAYAGATILLGGENFGCGSSREHAVWALVEYGFRAIIAPSFSPIFYNNCLRNGVLPARLASDDILSIARRVAMDPRLNRVSIDLKAQTIALWDWETHGFAIDPEAKTMLLEGLDEIALTLRMSKQINDFRLQDQRLRPWAYLGDPSPPEDDQPAVGGGGRLSTMEDSPAA
jgi:3-isopropylmalate/(R)-2-methylmalate dehydratase small subunit